MNEIIIYYTNYNTTINKKKTIVFSLWLTDVYVGKKARNIWFFFDSLPRLKTCLKTLVLNNQ